MSKVVLTHLMLMSAASDVNVAPLLALLVSGVEGVGHLTMNPRMLEFHRDEGANDSSSP